MIKVPHHPIHGMPFGATVGFVEDAQGEPGYLNKCVGQSICEHCRRAYDDMNSFEEGVPEVLISPFVDVVGTGQAAYTIRWKVLLKD